LEQKVFAEDDSFSTEVESAKDWYGVMSLSHAKYRKEVFCPTRGHMVMEEMMLMRRQQMAHEYLARNEKTRTGRYIHTMFARGLQDEIATLRTRVEIDNAIETRALSGMRHMRDLFGPPAPEEKLH
jgi:hypothetical protein